MNAYYFYMGLHHIFSFIYLLTSDKWANESVNKI